MATLMRQLRLLKPNQVMKMVGASYSEEYRFPTGLEHATGINLMEQLCEAAGIDDPFDANYLVVDRKSTADDPFVVRSQYNARLIGCLCDEDSPGAYFSWALQGHTTRCKCGHFFTLKEAKHPIDQAIDLIKSKMSEEEFNRIAADIKPAKNWTEYYTKLGVFDEDEKKN